MTASPSAIVFDMDGVLVDTSPCHQQAYGRLWENLGVDGPDYQDIAGRSTREVIATFCVDLDQDTQRECVKFKQQQALELLRVGDIIFPDTIEVLHELHQRGLRFALGTSASRKSAELVLKRLEASAFFDAVITAEDVSQTKPNPEVFISAMQRLSVSPADAVIVEDSKAGLEAGFGAGALVANVRQRIKGIRHPRLAGYFEDLHAFSHWMKNL